MATSSYICTTNAPLAGFIPLTAWTNQPDLGGDPCGMENESQIAAVTAIQTDGQTATSTVQPLDPDARERVLLEHMSIVRFVARRIHERLPQHVEMEDLVSAGVVGLIDAFQKFDAGKNVQFRSYAQFRIRGAILDSLRVLDWGSRDLRRKGRGIEEATQLLLQRLGRRPTENEIAAELGMSLAAYQQLLGELKGLEVSSLNETRSEDSSEEDLAYVPTALEEDPLFQCMRNQMSEQLSTMIATLPEREAKVLSLYYVEEMTMKEIGASLGVVESRVSQIHSGALKMLRHRFAHSGYSATRRPAPTRHPMPKPEARRDSRLSKQQGIIPAALIMNNTKCRPVAARKVAANR